MQIQNKENARMFMFRVKNFQGIEVFEFSFEGGKPCIPFGKNGAGKSSIINGIYMAFKGKGGVPVKIDHPVGPYSTSKIKKATVDIGIESNHEILELGGDSIKKLFLHFSITDKGSVSLKVTDEATGKNHTAPRDKIKQLLGMFVDPVELVNTLEEANGDRLLAEKLAAMVGQDLKPYAVKDEELFTEFQAENVEHARQKGEFDSQDVPQDDWAKKFVDPASISKQLQDLTSVYSELSQSKKDLLQVENTIAETRNEANTLETSLVERTGKLGEENSSLEAFKGQNKPVEWTGTKNIEDKIQQLTTELSLFREYEKREQKKKESIETKENNIALETERLSSSKKELNTKNEFLKKKEVEKEELQKVFDEKKGDVKKFLPGRELTPEEQEMTLSDYLKGKIASVQEQMKNIERDNEQVKNREKYELAEQGIKAVEASIQDIKKKRKENAAAKSKAVASVKGKFPHPGITVDFKDPNLSERDDIKKKNDITVWVDLDDRRGPRTINDLSEGEQLMICTHILIAGNTGKLNILLVRNGNRLDSDAQRMVYNIANEHGYDVILETIETSEAGALHIVDGKVDSINPPKEITEKEKSVAKDVQDDSGFNW